MPQEHEATDRPTNTLSASLLKRCRRSAGSGQADGEVEAADGLRATPQNSSTSVGWPPAGVRAGRQREHDTTPAAAGPVRRRTGLSAEESARSSRVCRPCSSARPRCAAGDGAGGQDSSVVPRAGRPAAGRQRPGCRVRRGWRGRGAPGVSQRVFGAGTQLLVEQPVKSSTALANACGFSSGMK